MWQDVRYDKSKYCCEHFLIDAYKHYTGKDLAPKLLTAGFFKPQNLRNFIEIQKPTQHSIVMFRGERQAHVGLWVDGQVLHLEPSGVVWQPLHIVIRGFERVRFYEAV